MAKSALEKQLEKQMKQAKDAQRKQEREARKAATRDRAASIISGQPLVEGFRIMDATAEEVLKSLLNCERSEGNRIAFSDDIFPVYIQMSVGLELEKLVQYGMIGSLLTYDNGGWLNLLPPALTYFEDKEQALKRQEENRKKMDIGNITNYGNLVFGNVSGSTLTVDNSIHEIEHMIDEHGGEDAEELHELLEEVKELVDNMQSSRSIPKQKKLFQRISGHLEKHGWFYGAVVQLLGTAALNMLGAG